MHIANLNNAMLHYRVDGPDNGAPLVFANSLGTDLRIWDAVVASLPAGLRIIRYDKRGHGLSEAPPSPYKMGTLVGDAEQLLDHLGVKDCVFIGLSIGGLIAQGLAAKRLDLMRAMVLSNTAAKIGTRDMWNARIAAIETGGIKSISSATMERWFSKPFRQTSDMLAWQHMMERQPQDGYIGCCAAIAGTDFITPTSGLRLPTLAIAGSEDGATPPDLVRETAELIPGSRFELMRNAGHLPCIEQPEAYARILTSFLRDIGHF
ncbi:3-oxoadipate enol-lactonase [Lentibacter algarum]|uniref:3-oxoadipate enol-lactonase n=1 Tax=Lentibacter algarum TaxID=576131 RepID=UPI001C0938A7|nr:3-oxoadipate enol-lactonase [Lentibacter algarum]MBU2982812.1 3-oxoadipate enol-lactonase [Lentibacter algarum]